MGFKTLALTISQEGENAPTIDRQHFNDVGLLTMEYVETGVFHINAPGGSFPIGKVSRWSGGNVNSGGHTSFEVVEDSETSLSIYAYNSSGELSNSVLDHAYLEIKIWD